MEKKLSELTGKLKTLNFTLNKTEGILEKQNREASERQETSILTKIRAINILKEEIEELKFIDGESDEQVQQWGEDIETVTVKADGKVRTLRQHIKETEEAEQAAERAQARNEQLAFEKAQHELQQTREEEDRKRQLYFERELLEQKLQYQKDLEAALPDRVPDNTANQGAAAKLPKLSITKFNGTYEAWLPFWGKFSAEIDGSGLAAVTKFAYLKELLEPNIRMEIDGLPFTKEGYQNAKAILEAEYGQTEEIVNAYRQNIAQLPVITGSNPRKVQEFYKNLLHCVQSLDTLGKLDQVTGNVRSVLDKLKGIKSDLVRGQDAWQSWDFHQLLSALKRWKDINPIETCENLEKPTQPKRPEGRTRLFNAVVNERRKRGCVYCGEGHASSDCTRVTTIDERKRILVQNRLCFNCTGEKHRAVECKSKKGCLKCGSRHHTSICATTEHLMTAREVGRKGAVVYPVVVVEVEGVKCRALLDTGAGSSYASAALLERLPKRSSSKEIRKIEMMLGVTTRQVEIYSINIKAVNGDFALNVEVTRVDKRQLLMLENPRYQQLLELHQHLKGVQILDTDDKAELPVHLILGASEFARIKTGCAPRVGRPGDPVAERTKYGWTLLSPGKELDSNHLLFAQTSHADYEELCRLDVLGLADTPEGDQMEVYREFKEQLKRSPEGWYETGLPWKGNHPTLANNKEGSLRRLNGLVRKLNKQDLVERYDQVIRDQLEEGIVEQVTGPPEGPEFYIPHMAVIREAAESTKLRVVYDASARAHIDAPSLNDCLHPGPPLQNQLWNVLVRSRFHPVLITGDLQKAFLQVRIKACERDALRFHWRPNEHSKLETLRFTRALFGLAPSPFLLGGVIQQHLESWRATYPESIREIERSLYVDDLITGSTTVPKVKELQENAIEVFADATFKLHKWHSNVAELQPEIDTPSEENSYAKQQLGAPAQGKGKLLGLPWDKDTDELSVTVPVENATRSKRGILGKIAKIYDPLGLVSPVTLSGKLLFRDVCNAKLAWDTQLPGELSSRWSKWERRLPDKFTMPRALATYQEPIDGIALHAFGDASGVGVAAAVYAVVQQSSGQTQGLVAAKARLAKQGLTIPRLELVSGHMACNLIRNVKETLDGLPVTSLHCWLDSSVALHWIRGGGNYKQFVANRVHKIQTHPEVSWRHVGTAENPADLGSRGGEVNSNSRLWRNGPDWLGQSERWPPDIITEATKESNAEAKATKELFAGAVDLTDEIDGILERFGLRKAIRVCAWISRFTHNSRHQRNKRTSGPLKTEELNKQHRFWIKRAQSSCHIEEDRLQLNLQENEQGILECRGRLQGEYPIYLPDTHPYTVKLVEEAHRRTLHGGVALTMTHVRARHWVPRLRRLSKRVIKACYGCRRFQTRAFASPPPGNLPRDRTEGQTAFQVVGVDYAGPLKYRTKTKTEGKAYIVLYACSLTRGLFLELLPNMETTEFLASLKRLIARRGRPVRIYSDNGRTFVGAARWIKQVMRDEKLHDFLAHQGIQWTFNLSRAPWWGGQFERLVGLVKAALYKTIGNGSLSWAELQEVLLDVEVALNNRPLSYVDDVDIQQPILTPNSLLYVQPNLLPELEPHHIQDYDLRKRAKHLKKCKDALWTRWTTEYLRGLREKHRLKYKGDFKHPNKGEVVIIKSEERNRGKWQLGIVEDQIKGRDGVVRGVKLRTGKNVLERAVQHIYPLELSCDTKEAEPTVILNADAAEFAPEPITPKRAAAQVARHRIAAIAEQ